MTPARTAARALVCGGAGFLGSHVCEALLQRHYSVVCVDDLSTGRLENLASLAGRPGFEFVRADITHGLDVAGPPLDLVLHLASPASPKDYLQLPVATLRAGSIGTLNALEVARRHGARLVLASTSEVYGDPVEHPQREIYRGNVNPTGPRSVYDEAKRFAEAAVAAYRREYGCDVAIARIFNTYGPRMRHDDGRAIPTFIHQALAGDPLTVAGDGRQTRSFCYVDDLVEGLLALAASAHLGPVNLGNPQEVSINDLAGLVLRLTGSRSGVEYVERPVDDPSLRCPDITRARQWLAWQPRTSLADGLARTVAWASAAASTHAPAQTLAPSAVVSS